MVGEATAAFDRSRCGDQGVTSDGGDFGTQLKSPFDAKYFLLWSLFNSLRRKFVQRTIKVRLTNFVPYSLKIASNEKVLLLIFFMNYQTFLLSLVAGASILVGAGCASSTARPSSTSASVTVAPAVDTSDWKTYENPFCSISLKYPKDAAVVSSSQRSVIISSQEDADKQNIQEGEAPSAYYIHMECKSLEDAVRENGSNFSSDSSRITNLIEFFAANTNPSIQKIGAGMVGGQPAIAAHIGASQWYSLWLDRGNVTVFDFSYAQTAAEISPIQQAILSSIVLTK